MKRVLQRFVKNDLVFVIVFLVLITISFFLDKYVLDLMQQIHNPILDYIMNWFSHLGSIVVVLLIVTSLFLWEEHKREWIPFLIISFVISLVACYALKWALIRPRPLNIEERMFGFTDYSFPSGHATASFSVLPILDKEFPKLKYFWICFASLVAFSRLYLLMHHLSDVLAGILLGYLVGKLMIYFEEQYGVIKRIVRKT
jgi:undecaprenyl-diphosphatase